MITPVLSQILFPFDGLSEYMEEVDLAGFIDKGGHLSHISRRANWEYGGDTSTHMLVTSGLGLSKQGVPWDFGVEGG